MSLIASPMPGSVVIQVAPSLARMDDLCPEGPGLFDLESEIDARPLADQAFIKFSELISVLNADDSDEGAFVDRLTDFGPRVATAMKAFCESVDKGVLDIEFEWTEPNNQPKNAVISHRNAGRAVSIIETAEIENEEVTYEDILLTLTQSSKDKLRLLGDTGDEIVIAFGCISPAETRPLHTGGRVRVLAEKRVSSMPGGKRSENLLGRR